MSCPPFWDRMRLVRGPTRLRSAASPGNLFGFFLGGTGRDGPLRLHLIECGLDAMSHPDAPVDDGGSFMPSRVLTFSAAARALLLVAAPLTVACTGTVGDGAGGAKPGTGSPSNPSTGGPSTGGGNPSTGGGNGGTNSTPVPPPDRPSTGACKTLDP